MKTRSVVIAVLMSLYGFGCAHHDNKVDHHHHEAEKKVSYEGKCAYSVENSKFDVVGKPDFQLEHQGTVYYFSSQEKLDLFKKELPHSARKADNAWLNRHADMH